MYYVIHLAEWPPGGESTVTLVDRMSVGVRLARHLA